MTDRVARATTAWVYNFGDGQADGQASMKNLLGGKGANLAEMSSLGLPVPPGFTITTEVCAAYYANDRRYPEALEEQVTVALDRVGRLVGARFGNAEKPLLVSVRSGARASMPGMMDTILNLGLNDVDRRGTGASSRETNGLRSTATVASSRCILTWCLGSTMARLRTFWRIIRT